MKELLPCPFCGEHDLGEFVGRDLLYHVMCWTCRAEASADSPRETRARWNHRAQSEQPDMVRGHWKEIKGSDFHCVHYYACSKCHKPALRDDLGVQVLSHVCPSCGAKMYGGEKGCG